MVDDEHTHTHTHTHTCINILHIHAAHTGLNNSSRNNDKDHSKLYDKLALYDLTTASDLVIYFHKNTAMYMQEEAR